MTKILKLNEISPIVNKALSADYEICKDCKQPDAILLRSFNMHEFDIPKSVLCIARAGAGTNNIPVDSCAQKGIVVFNTPGANANAVKELVFCALLLAARKVVEGIKWTSSLKGKGAEVAKLVEGGKSAFGGGELFGKTLGVVGLGAIGAMTANTAIDFGMKVIGYDPFISIDQAWTLSNSVSKASSLNEIFAQCDYITLHIPLNQNTKGFLNAQAFEKMKDGVSIVNCSRNELVNNADLLAALKDKKVSTYVTDFPSDELIDIENVVTIPHLGASTEEAEENCALMAAKQLADFVENGNIVNSVNFNNCSMPRSGKCRITIIHKNVKNVLNPITECISSQKINIDGMLNQSKGDYAYSIFELDEVLSDAALKKIESIPEVIRVRVI